MDEIITDFIIETCHAAALSASYSRRQKIKVDDFKWVLRRDGKKLGRVAETFLREKALKESRKAFQFDNPEALAGKRGKGAGAGGVAGIAGDEEDAGAGEGAAATGGPVKRRKKRKARSDV